MSVMRINQDKRLIFFNYFEGLFFFLNGCPVLTFFFGEPEDTTLCFGDVKAQSDRKRQTCQS